MLNKSADPTEQTATISQTYYSDYSDYAGPSDYSFLLAALQDEEVAVQKLGILTMVLSILFLIFQIIYIYKVAHRKPSFTTDYASVLLVTLSICDCCQLIAHAFSGYLMITDFYITSDQSYPSFIFGGLVTIGWNGSSFSLCLLSFHRAFFLGKPSLAILFFNRTLNMTIHLIFIIYCLLHFLLMVLKVETRVIFSPMQMEWESGKGDGWTSISSVINMASNIALVFVNLPFMAVIAYLYFIKKWRFRQQSENFIMFELTIFWLLAVFTCALWTFMPQDSLGDPTKSFALRYACNIFLWIFWNVIKPLVHLSREMFVAYFLACFISAEKSSDAKPKICHHLKEFAN